MVFNHSKSRKTVLKSVRYLIGKSRGASIRSKFLGARVEHLLGQVFQLGATDISVHNDTPAQLAATIMGVHAFCHGQRIFLGPTVGSDLGPTIVDALRHELIHVAQVLKGTSTCEIASRDQLEWEAERLAGLDRPDLSSVQGAAANEIYALWWFLPLAVGAYVLLRPNIANAPGPGDKTYPSVSEAQVAGEAFALFAVPGGAYALGGRLGLGFLGSSALAGASATTSFRAAGDIGQGRFSGIQVYVYDAATGAVIGVVVPGGIRLIGKGGTRTLDWLATQGMRRSDLAVTRILAERAATNPLSQAEVEALLRPQGYTGRMADWWMNRRGLVMLYRGQGQPTTKILSPLARGEGGVAASEAMVARMRALGITDDEIAAYTAQLHSQPAPGPYTLPKLVGERVGAAGIPTTRIPGVAANFGDTGVVYVIRAPRAGAIKVPPWGLSVENEWVVLHQIPDDWVVGTISPPRIPALEASEAGKLMLVPAR